MTRFVGALLSFALVGSLSANDTVDSPYNAGVGAWQKKDYSEAAKQWSQAVLAGNLDAMNNLAFLYFNGLGMKPRVPDAIRLWRIAAFAGHSEAQWHLGAAYEDGKGVEKDVLKAYAWYRCAIENAGHKKASDETEAKIEADAKESMNQLIGAMSPDDLKRAAAIANVYIQRFGAAIP